MNAARGAPRGSALLGLALGSAWMATWLVQSRAWRADPEYAYGWAVPLLVVFLLSERWLSRPAPLPDKFPWTILVALSPLAWLPARFGVEPFPVWPGMLWLHSLGTVAATLGIAGVLGGARWTRHFGFPVLFSLTALPWPGVLHRVVVQGLMSFVATLAAGTVDTLGWPARAAGHVIEVGRGWVGVDEACSGIRSLQATIMAALFLGEYLRARAARRWLLVGLGLASALVTNVGRTVALTLRAAQHGTDAVAAWHDPAGYAVLAINLGVLAAVAWRWRQSAAIPLATEPQTATSAIPLRLACGLLTAAVACDAAPRAWFAAHARKPSLAPEWTVHWPTHAAEGRAALVAESAVQMLHCDVLEGFLWRAENGSRREAFFIRWENMFAGRAALALHNPEICLPMAGARATGERPALTVATRAGPLGFRVLTFEREGRPFVVYQCIWNAGETEVSGDPRAPGALAWWRERWAGIVHGRIGATEVLTLACWDGENDPRATQDQLEELKSLIEPKPE